MVARRPPSRFRARLEALLRGRSPPDRRILFVGLLNEALPAGTQAVLVGGAAVEFYTIGGYVTGDVDLVGPRDEVAKVLRAAGFREEGRYFTAPELGIVCEVPDRFLRETEEVREVEFEGLRIFIVAPEDALVDRLLAAKYGRSPTDWEQAVLLFTAQEPNLRLPALRAKAQKNFCEDVLEDLVRRVRATGRKTPARRPGRRR